MRGDIHYSKILWLEASVSARTVNMGGLPDVENPADTNGRLRSALARWRAADDRLYPLVLVNPESYRRAVELVGRMVQELRRSCRNVDHLVEVDHEPSALLAAVRFDPADIPGINPQTLVQAACGLRGTELLAADHRRRRGERIALARESGSCWVTLEGSQQRIDSGERFLEMHVASGTALSAVVDPFSGDPPFHLEELRLDPVTGDPVGAMPIRWEYSFADRDSWLTELARRRELIAGAAAADG